MSTPPVESPESLACSGDDLTLAEFGEGLRAVRARVQRLSCADQRPGDGPTRRGPSLSARRALMGLREGSRVTEVRGFIVSAWDEDRPGAAASRRILATGRLEDGRSFALVLPAPAPAVYVAAEDGPRAAALLAHTHRATLDPAGWSDLAGAALARVDLPGSAAEDAWRPLAAGGTPALHVERARASDALLALGLTGPVALRGEPVPGRRVDLVFVNPELAPSTTVPALAWLALDIGCGPSPGRPGAALAPR